MRGARNREGFTWLRTALDDASRQEITPSVRARALADKASLNAWCGIPPNFDEADEALVIAREVGDPGLLVRALIARGFVVGYDAELVQEYFAEAVDLAREIDDSWRLTQILGWQSWTASLAGDPITARRAAEEGRLVADAIGNHFASRTCRTWLGWAYVYGGDLVRAAAQFDEVLAEVEAVNDLAWRFASLHGQVFVRAFRGSVPRARPVADAALDIAAELSGFYPGVIYGTLGIACLAEGSVDACKVACETATSALSVQPNAQGVFTHSLKWR